MIFTLFVSKSISITLPHLTSTPYLCSNHDIFFHLSHIIQFTLCLILLHLISPFPFTFLSLIFLWSVWLGWWTWFINTPTLSLKWLQIIVHHSRSPPTCPHCFLQFLVKVLHWILRNRNQEMLAKPLAWCQWNSPEFMQQPAQWPQDIQTLILFFPLFY